MDFRQREETVSLIYRELSALRRMEDPNDLIKVTSSVVVNAKKILEGVPDSEAEEGKSVLSQLILSTKAIAQDPTSSNAKAFQALSSSSRNVEQLVKRLNAWHASKDVGSDRRSPLEIKLEQISPVSGSPPTTPVSEREEKLIQKLEHEKRRLISRKEVRRSNAVPEDPKEILSNAVSVINSSVQEMEAELGKISPQKEPLLQPLLNLTQKVIQLLDLEDTLFVAKFPMRKQVHGFTEATVLKVLDPKLTAERAVENVREIRSNLKGLLQSAEVMVEQCYQRSRNIDDNKMKSIRRVAEFEENKRQNHGNVMTHFQQNLGSRKIVMESHTLKKPGEKTGFEISCLMCTSCAVDQSTHQPIARGSELVLQCSPNVDVLDIKKDLSIRTGLKVEWIELCIGKEPLENGSKLLNHGGAPFFLFNKNEDQEGEDSQQPRRKIIHDSEINWSQYSNPIARALYDYNPGMDGEDQSGNIAFFEGDIVEILTKSPDGWWEGKIDDRIGVFPASFVKDIVRPGIGHLAGRSMSANVGNSSAPVSRKFAPPPTHPQDQVQRSQTTSDSMSSSGEHMKKTASNPNLGPKKTVLQRPLSVASVSSKKSFSPRFAKKVSCLAAVADSDSESDDDRLLLQKKKQGWLKKGKDKGGKDKKSNKSSLTTSTGQPSSQLVPLQSQSKKGSNLVKGHYPSSPHSSRDDLSVDAVKRAAYQLGHNCIDYLMVDGRVVTDRLFRQPGNMAMVKKYLEVVDDGRLPSIHDLSSVHTACSTLKALFRHDRINYIVPEFLVQVSPCRDRIQYMHVLLSMEKSNMHMCARTYA
jgi:hypothetical protein